MVASETRSSPTQVSVSSQTSMIPCDPLGDPRITDPGLAGHLLSGGDQRDRYCVSAGSPRSLNYADVITPERRFTLAPHFSFSVVWRFWFNFRSGTLFGESH